MVIRRLVGVCSVVTVFVFAAAAHAGELVLADGGQSAYRIVVADDASPSTQHGAEELQKFLRTDDRRQAADRLRPGSRRSRKEIILGDNAHLRNAGPARSISRRWATKAT